MLKLSSFDNEELLDTFEL